MLPPRAPGLAFPAGITLYTARALPSSSLTVPTLIVDVVLNHQ